MGILHVFNKTNQHMGTLHAFSNCVRETFNQGPSPSEVDWGDPKGEPTKMLKHTSSGNMLMEVDWGGNLKHNNRSLSLNGTHPVEMGLVQCVKSWKLGWLIQNKVTTRVYLVRWTQRLNNQPKFG